MEYKKYFLWGGVVLLIVIGYFFPRPGPSVIERVVEKLGAFSGPVIDSDYLVFNGIEHRYFSQAFNTASTTLCSFRPNATSTLLNAFINIKTATSGTIVIDLGQATELDATTTRLANTFSLSANLKSNLSYFATSTNNAGLQSDITANYVFGPTEYVVVKFGGGGGATTTLGGNCQFEFLVH